MALKKKTKDLDELKIEYEQRDNQLSTMYEELQKKFNKK